MAYMGDVNYAACPSDGSCGCGDSLTSEDYPEPLELEDAFVEAFNPNRLEEINVEA